ncbi:hypothetical protein Bca4012_074729 [Brassica carinata]
MIHSLGDYAVFIYLHGDLPLTELKIQSFKSVFFHIFFLIIITCQKRLVAVFH